MTHDSRIGTLVGEFRITTVLASGDAWSTYIGERFSRRCVLRIANPGADAAIREKLGAVYDASRALGSPRVVEVEEWGTTRDGATFVRQPYVGDSLAAVLTRADTFARVRAIDPKHPSMPADRATAIVAEVLTTLADGHAKGLLHRDVRPSAIFPVGDAVLLGSFGFPPSSPWDASDEAVRFSSPEAAMGLSDQLDVRADLFSVGAVLRRLVTGHDLHEGLGLAEARIAAATEPVPRIGSLGLAVAPRLANVIDRALAWDRRARFANALEMREALG